MQRRKKQTIYQKLDTLEVEERRVARALIEVQRKILLLNQEKYNTDNRDYEEALQRILSLKQVKSLACTELENRLYLSVFTNPVTVIDSRTHRNHLLGPYKIELTIKPDDTIDFSYDSLWFMVTGHGGNPCSHPHVWGDGSQCLGSVEQDMHEFLARGDIFSFVMLSILFLESVNVADDAGMCVSRWPWIEDAGFDLEDPKSLSVKIIDPNMIQPPKVKRTAKSMDKDEYAAGMTQEEWTQWVKSFELGDDACPDLEV